MENSLDRSLRALVGERIVFNVAGNEHRLVVGAAPLRVMMIAYVTAIYCEPLNSKGAS